METSQIEFGKNDTPISKHFNDVYFSMDGGLNESRYVFFEQCGLIERFSLENHTTIGELGFGTGLNFLLAWKLFNGLAPRRSKLNFISFEAYPLSKEDLRPVHAKIPELSPFAEEFLEKYTFHHPGVETFEFDSGRVTLILFFMDAERGLKSFAGKADAWFLDGFAPSKNPGMWTREIFSEIHRHSTPGARLSTFTAATRVRKELQAVGFEMEKVPGFGRKREMLRGLRVQKHHGSTLDGLLGSPGFPNATSHPFNRTSLGNANPMDDVLIIGGGLAGCAAAWALRERGLKVALLERHAKIATEASGNPAAIYMPALTDFQSLIGRFSVAAFDYFNHQLGEIRSLTPGAQCGVLQLASRNRPWGRLERAFRSWDFQPDYARKAGPHEGSRIAGVEVPGNGFFFSQGGWLSPREFCKLQLQASRARQGFNAEAISLKNKNGIWRILNAQGSCLAQAATLILANAWDVRFFKETSWLPLRLLKGQILELQEEALSNVLRAVVSFDHYIAPLCQGRLLLGASYELISELPLRPPPPEPSLENSKAILKETCEVLPALKKNLNATASPHCRASYRCIPNDSLPLVGPVPSPQAYLRDFKNLHHSRDGAGFPDGEVYPGLYVLSGLGSRGLTYAQLGAATIAAQICGEPLPLERELAIAVHPARFLLRALRHSQPLGLGVQ